MRHYYGSWWLVALFALVGGCSSDETAYERGVAGYEPVYCYRSLGDADCYRDPIASDARSLINFYGPAPRHFADSPGPGGSGGDDDADETALMPPPTLIGLGLGAVGTAVAGPAGGVAAAGGSRLLGVFLQPEDEDAAPGHAPDGRTASGKPIRLDPPPPANDAPGGVRPDMDRGRDVDGEGARDVRSP